MWGFFLILGALWLGFAAGAAFAGRLLVAKGSGLSGPAEAIGYGLLTGLVAAVVAGFATYRAPRTWVIAMGKVALVLTLLLLGVVMYRIYVDINRQQEPPLHQRPTAPADRP